MRSEQATVGLEQVFKMSEMLEAIMFPCPLLLLFKKAALRGDVSRDAPLAVSEKLWSGKYWEEEQKFIAYTQRANT